MDNVKCYWGHCSNTKCFLVYVFSHFDFGYFKFSFDLILSYCINLYLMSYDFGLFWLILFLFDSCQILLNILLLIFFAYYACASKGGYFTF